MQLSQSTLLALFIIWGIPLGWFRSKFRKIVYKTDSWLINIQPYFWQELRGLFGNLYPNNHQYVKVRNGYRLYLIIYAALAWVALF